MRALDLNREFSVLLSLICEAIEEFRHYDLRKIAISISTSKGAGKNGTWAYVVPLMETGGRDFRRGIRWGIPGHYRLESTKIHDLYPDAKYLMTFLVPKFFRLSPEERLETLVHELYHLHPTLRGDLRRFPRPHVFHGPTPRQYKKKVMSLCLEAKSNFQEILSHPLLADQVDEGCQDLKRRHFPIPKRVFKPLSLFGALGLFVAAGFLSLVATAQEINVRLQKDATLFSAPSVRSTEKALLGSTDVLKATKLNFDRTWVYVVGEGKEGWLPRHLLSVVTVEGTVAAPAPQPTAPNTESVAQIPPVSIPQVPPPAVDGDEEFVDKAEEEIRKQEDPLPSSTTALKSIQFFEKADVSSKRHGDIEKGDTLEVLDANKERTWYFLRLPVTGEEGWLPSESLEISKEKAEKVSDAGNDEMAPTFEEDELESELEEVQDEVTGDKVQKLAKTKKPSHNHFLGPELSYATKGLGFGLGFSYHYSFDSGGETGSGLRYEIGPHFAYYFGRKLEDDLGAVTTSSFLLFDLEGRLVLDQAISDLGVAIGAGVAHLRPRISKKDASGDSVAVVSNTAQPQTGFMVGAHLLLPVSTHLNLEMGVRAYLTKTKFVSVGGSIVWNF